MTKSRKLFDNMARAHPDFLKDMAEDEWDFQAWENSSQIGTDFWFSQRNGHVIVALKYEDPDDGITAWFGTIEEEVLLDHPVSRKARDQLLRAIRKVRPDAKTWLDEPNDSLEGSIPRNLLATAEGRAKLRRLIGVPLPKHRPLPAPSRAAAKKFRASAKP